MTQLQIDVRVEINHQQFPEEMRRVARNLFQQRTRCPIETQQENPWLSVGLGVKYRLASMIANAQFLQHRRGPREQSLADGDCVARDNRHEYERVSDNPLRFG